ncbi:MAG TPA: hypothetical protein PLM62_04485 [Zoogloea sp.]|nr:hypothetical protein [Zoogloea sp.]
MTVQNATGRATEQLAREKLEALGLATRRPSFDDGVDLEVFSPKNPQRIVRIQVKGRGEKQSNQRYRWFQLRTTENQRRMAQQAGMEAADAYKIKAAKSEIFILVALKYTECWVFTTDEILDIIELNKAAYGTRRDNLLGHQKEMDLDIVVDGVPLTERYRSHLNNFQPVLELLAA